MNDELREFYSNNEVRVGEDFTRTPPIYYDSLNIALYHFFKTFQPQKDTYHFSLDFVSNTRESLAFNFSDLENTTQCIIAFLRFFELFLKDIIKRNIPSANIEKWAFQKAYKKVIKEISNNSSGFRKYKFLLDEQSQNFMDVLKYWRNRIMHNGSIFINNHALDFLVSQQAIPLILKVHKAEKISLNNYIPHYFRTASGINIIKRISEIKFEIADFQNPQKHQELAGELALLNHLKELGRACYVNRLNYKANLHWNEPYYENPIGRGERFAKSEKTRKDLLYNIRKCPCCGVKSLVVYRKEFKDVNFKVGEMDFISWFTCYTCSYSVKKNMDDPYYFRIFRSKVFPEQ